MMAEGRDGRGDSPLPSPIRRRRPSTSRERRLVERLLGERGVGRRSLFLTQREGIELPDGVEAVSGFALVDGGDVYGFWLGWDAEGQDYTLAPFYRVDHPERAFADDAEYHAARRRLARGEETMPEGTVTAHAPTRPAGFALHTWTLDTTPLADVLRIARRTGWEAVELRQVDFLRAAEAGQSDDEVIALIREAGLPVACVGAAHGWMFAEGGERRRLFEVLVAACRQASALACPTVMSPADMGAGDLRDAVAGVRQAGDLAAQHGLRLAIEPPSQSEQFNTLARIRELLAAAAHPSCGLLLDAYHIQRSGDGLDAVRDVAPDEIAYVQYSDLPAGPLEPGMLLDRLPPGQGLVPFREFFALVQSKGYAGHLSYEAPNPAAWARDPEEVAREALEASRALVDL
jgi:2-keto-myo-inositol isomerase